MPFKKKKKKNSQKHVYATEVLNRCAKKRYKRASSHIWWQFKYSEGLFKFHIMPRILKINFEKQIIQQKKKKKKKNLKKKFSGH